MKIVNTTNAPAAIGPYSQAVKSANLIFCSGQIGINPDTGNLAKGLESQINQIMKNIASLLESSNSSIEHVLKTTVFITDMKDFPIVNKVYGNYFSKHKPARSTVGVASLPKGALVEIEVIAEQLSRK